MLLQASWKEKEGLQLIIKDIKTINEYQLLRDAVRAACGFGATWKLFASQSACNKQDRIISSRDTKETKRRRKANRTVLVECEKCKEKFKTTKGFDDMLTEKGIGSCCSVCVGKQIRQTVCVGKQIRQTFVSV